MDVPTNISLTVNFDKMEVILNKHKMHYYDVHLQRREDSLIVSIGSLSKSPGSGLREGVDESLITSGIAFSAYFRFGLNNRKSLLLGEIENRKFRFGAVNLSHNS